MNCSVGAAQVGDFAPGLLVTRAPQPLRLTGTSLLTTAAGLRLIGNALLSVTAGPTPIVLKGFSLISVQLSLPCMLQGQAIISVLAETRRWQCIVSPGNLGPTAADYGSIAHWGM